MSSYNNNCDNRDLQSYLAVQKSVVDFLFGYKL